MIEGSITTGDIAEAIRTLADQVEASEIVDGSVVCVIRIGSDARVYALGDDLDSLIASASDMITGAHQSLMLRRAH